MSKVGFLFQRPFVVFFALILLVITEPIMASDAIPAPREGTLRSFATSGESLIRLDLDTTGIVTVEVARASYKAGGARLGLPQGEGRSTLIERSATHLAFAVRKPGVWFLPVVSEDPRQPLQHYKLTTSFVEAELSEASFELDAGLRAVQTDFQAANGSHLIRLVRYATGAEQRHEDHEVDPDPLGWDPETGRTLARVVLLPAGSVLKRHEDHEVDPDPLHGGIGPSRSITAVVTFPAMATARHEDHEVDPDPLHGGTVAAVVAEERGRLLRFSTSDDAFTGTDALAVESRVAWLRWLAGWIFPDVAPAHDERFQLLAYTSASEASMLRLRSDERCAHLGLDEPNDVHGDTFACAMPLTFERPVVAEIGNSWGDDEDVFTFTLTEMRTVQIEAAGQAELIGNLHDHRGQRLESATGQGGALRIVRSLHPGRYFLRLGGGREGSYGLTLASRNW